VTSRVLLAVDDSRPALAAARTAVGLAAALRARLCAVTVLADGVLTRRIAGITGDGEAAARRELMSASVLRHVAALAKRSGVPVDSVIAEGEPAAAILDQASAWRADMIVLGRSDQEGPGSHLGSQTLQVLEFAEVPVLVVPAGTGRLDGSDLAS
jgi:nucleotide-binding universal stress UspA family protein